MDSSKFLSPEDYKARTGLSIKTVMRRLRDGKIPAIQPGGAGTSWRIDPRALEPATGRAITQGFPNGTERATPLVSENYFNTALSPRLPLNGVQPPAFEVLTTGAMSGRRKADKVRGKYFTWLLKKRGKYYQLDGRSNKPSPGRIALRTGDRDQALIELQKKDVEKAVELGLASPEVLAEIRPDALLLEVGRDRYMEYIKRPAVVGGGKKKTVARYRTVFAKAIPVFRRRGLTTWNAVKRRDLEYYAAHLDAEGYAYATEFLEITTLKQAFRFWIKEGLLPPECRIELPMVKPTETDTYCYSPQEVWEMETLCYRTKGLEWLGDVITALRCTGMRISELATLRWSDIDFEVNIIRLVDESRTKRAKRPDARSTKSKRGRTFPIHPDLRPVLERLRAASAGGTVFKATRGGVLRPDNMRHILINKVIKPLSTRFPSGDDEIGFKDGRIHSFRHHFVSVAATSLVSEQLLMRWLGHQSSRMVQRYFHTLDGESQRQMKQVRFFGGQDASSAPG